MRPAMQVADAFEVFPMLDGDALRAAVEKHRPDVIVPEIEAIDTATLAALESEGWRVAPSAKAVQLTMNRDGIRDFAASELGLRHLALPLRRKRATRPSPLPARSALPCVVKPVMSSSGKGQSIVRNGRGGRRAPGTMRSPTCAATGPRVIVEEFIDFDSEITLLTVATRDGILFCPPIGHRQEAGDYRESWQPAAIPREALHSARYQARKVVEALGGHGIFGVEFFVRGDQAIFSELSPAAARHRHGHADLAIPQRVRASPARDPRPADPVDRARRPVGVGRDPRRSRRATAFPYEGVGEALALGAPGNPVDLRIFAKPRTLTNRRMGIALARAETVEDAVARAKAAAARVAIRYTA